MSTTHRTDTIIIHMLLSKLFDTFYAPSLMNTSKGNLIMALSIGVLIGLTSLLFVKPGQPMELKQDEEDISEEDATLQSNSTSNDSIRLRRLKVFLLTLMISFTVTYVALYLARCASSRKKEIVDRQTGGTSSSITAQGSYGRSNDEITSEIVTQSDTDLDTSTRCLEAAMSNIHIGDPRF